MIVTSPSTEHSSSKFQKSSDMIKNEILQSITELKAQKWYFITPVDNFELALLREKLKQFSLDIRVHRDEKRTKHKRNFSTFWNAKKHKRNFSTFFNAEALKFGTVEPRSASIADSEVGLRQSSQHRDSQRNEYEQKLYNLKKFLEEDAKCSRNDESLPHSSSLERNEDSKPTTKPKIAEKEAPSPPTFEETRKANDEMAVAKSRGNDDWIKVKAPVKLSSTEEDWELLEADQDEKKWTLI